MNNFTFNLDDDDFDAFKRLRPQENVAFKFWRAVWPKYAARSEFAGNKKSFPTIRYVKDREFRVTYVERNIKEVKRGSKPKHPSA